MEIYGKTDIGKITDVNQDTFSFVKLSDNLCFAFVCDGMGGTNGGKLASEIASKVLFKVFSENLSDSLSSVQVKNLTDSAFKRANDEILSCSRVNSSLAGMGTTVVGLILIGNNLHIFNIGDSRAYLFDEMGLVQLTIDHSYVQTLIDCGKLKPNEARFHPRKNEITKAMGISSNIDYDFRTLEVKEKNCLMLCSDGLTNVCDDEKILEILSFGKNIEHIVLNLIDYANSNGGYDNITVVLVRI